MTEIVLCLRKVPTRRTRDRYGRSEGSVAATGAGFHPNSTQLDAPFDWRLRMPLEHGALEVLNGHAVAVDLLAERITEDRHVAML